MNSPKLPWRRALAWGLLALVLAAVVGLYQRPDMLIMVSEQLWACF